MLATILGNMFSERQNTYIWYNFHWLTSRITERFSNFWPWSYTRLRWEFLPTDSNWGLVGLLLLPSKLDHLHRDCFYCLLKKRETICLKGFRDCLLHFWREIQIGIFYFHFQSPEIYLKRGREDFDPSLRLDRLLKRKAVCSAFITCIIKFV